MIYTLGETLLDIIINHNDAITATPGGSMLNVAVSLARRNSAVALISELGDDNVGAKVKRFLEKEGIDTTLLQFYKTAKTSLALAFLDEHAKPSYSFYKTYPEHRTLKTSVPFAAVDYLIFGSVYSLDNAIRKDVVKIVKSAKKQRAVIVYDPNIRHAYHLDDNEMRKAVFQNIAFADIIKGSDEDFTNIFGKGEPRFWKQKIREINNRAIVVVTLGAEGAVLFVGDLQLKTAALETQVVSTVGAGDAFSAGLLIGLSRLKLKPDTISPDQWKSVLEVAIAFSAEVCVSENNYVDKNF